MELTINLPRAVFEQLRSVAELTNQSLDDLVLQSIAGNLPPDLQNVPTEVKGDLLQMQTLGVEELRAIARAQISAEHQEEHLALLDKNQSGSLTKTEQIRLKELRVLADQLMLQKAHACAILRWRGQPIRSLEQLSLA